MTFPDVIICKQDKQSRDNEGLVGRVGEKGRQRKKIGREGGRWKGNEKKKKK